MNFFYKYIKSFILFLLYIILFPIFLTIMNLVKINTNKIIIIISGSIFMFIIGLLLGKKTNKNGYLNGLLLSTISVFFIFISSLIFKYSLNINSLIYYLVLIISTIFGSIIGVNKKIK